MRQWHLLGLFVLAAGQLAGQGGLSLTASMPSPIKGIIGNTYGAVFGRSELVTIPLVARFTATGGTPPYTYTIQSGLLPSGLLLNPTTGVIQGVPTGANGTGVVVQAQDAQGRVATYNWGRIRVESPPEFFFQGMVGSSFKQATPMCGLAGGTGFRYQLSSVPQGLEVVPAGPVNSVVGSPATEGSFLGSYSCENGQVRFEWRFRLRVDPMPVYYLPATEEGKDFEFLPVEFPGNPLGAQYEITVPGPPPGVAFTDPVTGRMTGQPTETGTFRWELKRSAEDGTFRTHRYVLLVNADPEKDPDRLTVNKSHLAFRIPEGQSEPVVGAFLVRAGRSKLIRAQVDTILGGFDQLRLDDIRITPVEAAQTDVVVEVSVDVAHLRKDDRVLVIIPVSRRDSEPPYDWLEPELTLRVEITVEGKGPKLEVSKTQITERYSRNGYWSWSSNCSTSLIEIRNKGGGELEYSLSSLRISGNQKDWIRIRDEGRKLGPNSTSRVLVDLKCSDLPLGTYNAQFDVTAPDQPLLTVDIVLQVEPAFGTFIQGELYPLISIHSPPLTENYKVTITEGEPGDEWVVWLPEEDGYSWLKLQNGRGRSGDSFQLTFDPSTWVEPYCGVKCGYKASTYLMIAVSRNDSLVYNTTRWAYLEMTVVPYVTPFISDHFLFLPSRSQNEPSPETATTFMVNVNPSEQAFRSSEFYWPGNPTRQAFLDVQPKLGTLEAGDFDPVSPNGVGTLTLASAPGPLDMPGFYLSDVTLRFRDLGSNSGIEHPKTFRVGQLVGRTGEPVPPTPTLSGSAGKVELASRAQLSATRPSAGVRQAVAGCAPGPLLVVTLLEPLFKVPSGSQRELRAKVMNACGEPVREGLVTADFSNGDPSVPLFHQEEGQWAASWIPRTEAGVVRVTLEARADEDLYGRDEVLGSVLDPGGPLLDAQGVRHAATGRAISMVTPGMLIRLQGRRFTASAGEAAESGTTAAELAGTQVVMAGMPLELLEVTPGEVLLRIPEDIEVGQELALMLRRAQGGSLAVGIFPVIPASPGILTADGSGSGQGLIYTLRDGRRMLAAGPQGALAEELVAIEVSGLGVVREPGQERTPLRVLLGEDELEVIPESVASSPGKPGVSDVVFRMPVNRPIGAAVPVRVEAAGFRSVPVTMSIEPGVQ